MELIKRLLSGDRLSLARVLTHVENRGEQYQQIMASLFPLAGRAYVIGITGPPGAGKSTLTDQVVALIRNRGERVAVVAVDPSSPFTGGAILGDRIRMNRHVNDNGVFIRSLGTRGQLGGLSRSSRDLVTCLDAAGFPWIIVETAGVGQTELEILKLAHAVCVVLVPESGDGIQIMKAGLMEIADIFAVNKSDRPESDKIVRELVTMVHLGTQPGQWEVPVVKTQANDGIGIDSLWESIERFKAHGEKSGLLVEKRRRNLENEVSDLVTDRILKSFHAVLAEKAQEGSLDQLHQRLENPYEFSNKVLKRLVDKINQNIG